MASACRWVTAVHAMPCSNSTIPAHQIEAGDWFFSMKDHGMVAYYCNACTNQELGIERPGAEAEGAEPMKLKAIWYWLSGGKRCAYCHEWFPLRELWCMFTGYDDRVNYMHLCGGCNKELAGRFQRRGRREKAINAPKAICRECGKAAVTTFGGMPMCAECDARLTQMFEHDKATGAWR